MVLPARNPEHQLESDRPWKSQPHQGNAPDVGTVMGSHSLNDPDPFPVNGHSRDIQQGNKGLGSLQLHGLLDFLHGLGDFGGRPCASEIHQEDFGAVMEYEIDGNIVGLIGYLVKVIKEYDNLHPSKPAPPTNLMTRTIIQMIPVQPANLLPELL